MRRILPIVLFALLRASARGETSFSRDVLPILSDKCFYCHGQDENHRKGDRRLDTHEGALAEKDGVRAVVPGDVAKSELVTRIFTDDPEEVMPPPKEKKRLTPEQKETLKKWVAEGAKWGTHWAFTAPVKPAVPTGGHFAQRNPIDAFIQARLEQEKLAPSPEADPATLLRRLSLDLVGLPPTPAELDAFLADHSPEAYQKQVERLLASPHYGERFGRDWLDAARYADSNGFEKDAPRFAWFYRDWVIDAFNRDLPYNQFLIDQLAGDLLPGATQAQHVATGFLRNSMINEEGGVDPEQFRMEAMFDRMDAIGKSMLGLTIQCAQCHSHKFDPITQTEYYRIFAFLNDADDAQPVVYTPEQEQKRADLFRQIGDEESRLRELLPDWEARLAKWEDEQKAITRPTWTVIQPEVEDISTGGQRYLPQGDGCFRAAGFQPVKHEVKMTIKVNAPSISAFQIEALTDDTLPANGPGRSHLGTFGLTEFKVESAPADGSAKPVAAKFNRAVADYEPAPETPVIALFNEKEPKHRVIGPASYAIDGNEETAWSNDLGPGRRNHDCHAIFVLEKPLEAKGETELTIHLAQKHGGWNADDLQANNLGRFRLSYTAEANAERDILPADILTILAVPRTERSPAQMAALFSYWRLSVPEAAEINAKIEALWKQHPEGITQLTLAQRNGGRETHRLNRGDWLKPAEAVTPGTPAFLPPLPKDAPLNRLTFARWLASDTAPTTARVLVNRLWQHYFGIGLVATAEDFGLQSEAPSHPELLDWLACEFMEHGWSIKHLQQLIVSSGTYRQASIVRPELYQRDPYNRLLARGPRFRVEGEVVRDIQLAASGLIDLQVGGRSVMPPAPTFLFLPPASYAPFPWVEETGPDRYRRGVYIYRRRSTPYPVLATFDTPEGNVSICRRNRANTPLQALTTLNETTAIEAARALAKRTLEEGGSSDLPRIEYAFRRCLSRPPTAAETDVMAKLLAKQTHRCEAGEIDPWLVATGEAKPGPLPAGATPAQLAAYTVFSRVLLNLDETITKE